jgi:sulfur carrier protein
MQVVVNGESREITEQSTVKQLLDQLGLTGQLVAVERNHAIVPRAQHAETQLSDGDEIEVVHFVGGG